jgi:hypothetical protein
MGNIDGLWSTGKQNSLLCPSAMWTFRGVRLLSSGELIFE